jgi:DNA (cytosine-5)-methyltransferase 1
MKQQTYIAFSSKDSGNDAGDLAPTLRSMNNDKSHINGGGQVAVAFTERARADGRNFEAQEELAYALTNPGSGGRTHSRQISDGYGVRRLTPTECERLQGFPDSHTATGSEGKPISDSARYRMLGNAVAVPCADWIGRQIMESEKDK